MKGFTTKAIHGVRNSKDPHGALRTPVYDTVAFEFEHAQDIQHAFEGKKPAHAYSRITNPTVEDFEQRIRVLSDATSVIAVSSCMAAISSLFVALAETGANIVTTRHLFGNTASLFESTLGDWGLEVRYADMNVPHSLGPIIDSATRAVFVESITNPQLEVADIKAIVDVASSHNVPVVLDGTVTTPYIFKSKDFGVAVEVLSSTKYISGGATSVGGLILDNGNFDWKKNPKLAENAKRFGPFALTAKLRKEVYRNFGACLSPHAAYLQSLGLETMSLRVERSCQNALALAAFLESQKAVTSVNYPGLRSSPWHGIAANQFSGRYGGLLTFCLGSQEECFKLIDSLSMIRRATNLNDNKTLILHPASTIFCEFSPEERETMGVPETLIRLAVGIEDIEDIADDLEQGLRQL